WSVEPNGGSFYFNKRYQDHFRSVIANFDALGEPRIDDLLQQLVHPEDAPGIQRTLRNCFETHDIQAEEIDHPHIEECRLAIGRQAPHMARNHIHE
ncbi:hypothetical protein ACC771_15295, partial [Rhizobium ruizarguesonis]